MPLRINIYCWSAVLAILIIGSMCPYIVYRFRGTKISASSSSSTDIREIITELRPWLRRELERQLSQFGIDNSRINAQPRKQIEDPNDQVAERRPNFAAFSAGATVISASKTWTGYLPSKYFLFIPITTSSPVPNMALQPWKEPGDCWPMQGSTGYLLIHLAASTMIEAFTLEHVDSSDHLAGVASEAPKNFSVYGVSNPDKNSDKHLFGVYYYDNKGASSQTFNVQQPSPTPFWHIDLVIGSNHYNDKYTCLYRFKVHGRMSTEQCPM